MYAHSEDFDSWEDFKLNAVATITTCENHRWMETNRPELWMYEYAFK